MNLELSSRERTIGLALIAAVIAVALATCASVLRARRALIMEADALRTHLSAAKTDRDAKTTQIEPFAALAERQFPSSPPEQRLSLLLQRIEALTSPMSKLRGRRHLDSEAIARIRAKLDLAPGLDIEVGGIWQDAEALALAEELKSVFDGAGFKTRKLVEYIPTPAIPPGVAIYSKHHLDHVLSDAIAQIFSELDQKPFQWLEDDLVSSIKQSEPQPELKIIVSHQ